LRTCSRAGGEALRLGKLRSPCHGLIHNDPEEVRRGGLVRRGDEDMIVGSTAGFAIESELSRAYERLSFRGLGFFLIHLEGMSYGVRAEDATLLACSCDEVAERLAARGEHTALFASFPEASRLADAATLAVYGDVDEEAEALPGLSFVELRRALYRSRLVWAPDGDEAFDDGSSVLQFDVGARVRLVGFRRSDYRHEPGTLRDVWLDSDQFYDVLQRWWTEFDAQWAAAPKEPEDAPAQLRR